MSIGLVKFKRSWLMLVCLLLGSSFASSCAGPTSPFGHFNVFEKPHEQKVQENFRKLASLKNTIQIDSMKSQAQINLTPDWINFNHHKNIEVKIVDISGVSSSYIFKVYLNGAEVTEQFLNVAKKTINHQEKSITFSTPKLSFLPERDNHIVFSYQKDSFSEAIIETMSMPKCNYYDYQPIKKLSPFRPKKQFLGHIIDAAYHEQINPSLLAALIAQESGFNSMAVSHAKAIGLTQVTENAEPHILENSDHWPQYPQLNQFNVPTIKTLIYLGKVNAQNEWRLNPYLSMRGGAKYLKYLEDYWSSADAKYRIQTHLNSNWDKTSDLILASYNSGPFRVKQELTKYGPDWLNSPKLKEAKKYVSRVRSFCHEFRTAGK